MADSDPEAAVRLVAEDDELSWADLAALGRAHCERGDTAAADSVIGRLDPAADDAAGIGASARSSTTPGRTCTASRRWPPATAPAPPPC